MSVDTNRAGTKSDIAPRLSIVVPSHQRRGAILRFLDSVEASTEESDDVEVVVVLDGSTDGSAEALADASYGVEVRHHWQPHAGRSAARNTGIALATGTICWLLDDDMTIERRALLAHTDFHANAERPAVLVGPQLEPEFADRYFNDRTERLIREGTLTTPFDFWTGNVSLPLHELRSIGGFDETFVGWGEEDIELGFRLFEAGLSIQVDATAAARHWRTRSSSEQIRLERERGRNLVRLCDSHPEAVGRLFPSSAVVSALHRRNIRSARFFGGLATAAELMLRSDRICASRQYDRINGIGRSAGRLAGVLDGGGSETVQRTVTISHHVFQIGEDHAAAEAGGAATSTATGLRAEYEEMGFLRQCLPVERHANIANVVADAGLFAAAVGELRDAGEHRVPYFFTPAIEALALDPAITDVVEQLLGDDRWVTWGSNIQIGTPNDAHAWHRDVESIYWPIITVVVGLDGCSDGNATSYIPRSHQLPIGPEAAGELSNSHLVLATARQLDRRCDTISHFENFGEGMFGVFDARGWHRGDIKTSTDRLALFLHYQRSDDPRIPYMRDFERNGWFDHAAEYLPNPALGDDYECAVHAPPGPEATSRRANLVAAARRTVARTSGKFGT